MIMRIKSYAVNVIYLPGNYPVLADALSRAYLPVNTPDQPEEFEIHLLNSGNLSETMLHKLTNATVKDPELHSFRLSWMAGHNSAMIHL